MSSLVVSGLRLRVRDLLLACGERLRLCERRDREERLVEDRRSSSRDVRLLRRSGERDRLRVRSRRLRWLRRSGDCEREREEERDLDRLLRPGDALDDLDLDLRLRSRDLDLERLRSFSRSLS
jgi:hypothetical protein